MQERFYLLNLMIGVPFEHADPILTSIVDSTFSHHGTGLISQYRKIFFCILIVKNELAFFHVDDVFCSL